MVTVMKIEVDAVEVGITGLKENDVFLDGHGSLCKFHYAEMYRNTQGEYSWVVHTSTGAMMHYATNARVIALVTY